MQKFTMAIAGMTCGGCVSAVTRALRAVPGTRVDAVTVGSATVSYDAARTNPLALGQAVRSAGYEPAIAGVLVPAGPTVAAGSGCCGGGSSSAGGCCS